MLDSSKIEEYTLSDEDLNLMERFEDDYMTIHDLISYLNSYKADYDEKSTLERSSYALENFRNVIVHVEKALSILTTASFISPERTEPASQLPKDTSNNTIAVIALNELAPSKDDTKEKKIAYKKALEDVFDSTAFSKKLGEHGIRMSSFSLNAKELIISIVNRNPSGGIPRKEIK